MHPHLGSNFDIYILINNITFMIRISVNCRTLWHAATVVSLAVSVSFNSPYNHKPVENQYACSLRDTRIVTEEEATGQHDASHLINWLSRLSYMVPRGRSTHTSLEWHAQVAAIASLRKRRPSLPANVITWLYSTRIYGFHRSVPML